MTDDTSSRRLRTGAAEGMVALATHDGAELPTLVFRPTDPGPHPAIVVGVEAYGVNEFGRGIAAKLVAEGYVVLIPDYYRGNGLADPESYLDFDEVMRFIAELDFTAAARDLLTAVEFAADADFVDADRIAVWGYCTGATLALLAAELSDRIAGAVLFFPSQPRFAELTPKTPVHPMDLLWALRCPTLFLYGDQDAVMPPEAMADLRTRLASWHIEHQVNVYPEAGHAFAAPVAPLRNDAADRASWADATEFLRAALKVN
jgi:carboxymethylenebutenolidase